MTISNRMRAGIALVACAAVGAAGGIAGSAAAPSKTTKSSKTAAAAKARAGRPPRDGHGGPGGRAVHSEEVVLNKAGDTFITETEDNGTIKSISGSDVTITEAIGSVTYKDVTITLPDSATIERNGKTAKVGDLKTGDHIHVSQSSDGTDVHAGDDTFKPRGPGGPGRDGHGPPPGGPRHP
jgi:hypothetical protein